jgi:hypothetical protein
MYRTLTLWNINAADMSLLTPIQRHSSKLLVDLDTKKDFEAGTSAVIIPRQGRVLGILFRCVLRTV